ncbi:VOC family protein [Halopenitus persicus]|uniref:Lactoylglutathione lyase n=1 Tax=Halopenitus persicus TaxID=1048396 RepID=A0A1H3JWY7_9EURY|nr:VOC family protein [Halopenitus persicus]QHS15730.1 VOC family protein [haloarchaeon 3A1-DGR]SDY44129.1 lactoylglutathione lyase [Halopenitus persicus]
MDVIHVAIPVSDLESTLEFYVDGVGLERSKSFTGDDGIENVYVSGDSAPEIQFTYDPETPLERSGRDARPLREHVAIGVEDVDETFRRLVDRVDPPVVAEPYREAASGSRIAFVRDPDGYVVELVERTTRPEDS